MPPPPSPPPGATTATVRHRVGFYETDAMGIVHHSNYLRYFERSRVVWLEDHDMAYPRYMELDLHFATTRAELDYHQPARFDDWLEVTTWPEWVRGASLRMAYRIERDGLLLASGATEHAAIDGQGRVRRIPRENRERIRSKLGTPTPA